MFCCFMGSLILNWSQFSKEGYFDKINSTDISLYNYWVWSNFSNPCWWIWFNGYQLFFNSVLWSKNLDLRHKLSPTPSSFLLFNYILYLLPLSSPFFNKISYNPYWWEKSCFRNLFNYQQWIIMAGCININKQSKTEINAKSIS